jgi:hypothetical protein
MDPLSPNDTKVNDFCVIPSVRFRETGDGDGDGGEGEEEDVDVDGGM